MGPKPQRKSAAPSKPKRAAKTSVTGIEDDDHEETPVKSAKPINKFGPRRSRRSSKKNQAQTEPERDPERANQTAQISADLTEQNRQASRTTTSIVGNMESEQENTRTAERSTTSIMEAEAQATEDGPFRGIDIRTEITRFNGDIVQAGSLMEGDQLLGIDGKPRTVSNIVRKRAVCYEVEIRRVGGHYAGLHLSATADCILHIQSHNEDPTIVSTRTAAKVADDTVKDAFGKIFGGQLSTPSTVPSFSSANRSQPVEGTKTRNAASFEEAMRGAFAWLLTAKGPDTYAGKRMRNTLHGTQGVTEDTRASNYGVRKVTDGKSEQHYFSWLVDLPRGLDVKKSEQIVYLPTKEAALAAAVAKSRELFASKTSWTNLHERYLDLKRRNPPKDNARRPLQLSVDDSLPGLFLILQKDGIAIEARIRRTRTSTSKLTSMYRRWKFPGFSSRDSEPLPENENDDLGKDDEQIDDQEQSNLWDDFDVQAHENMAVIHLKTVASLMVKARSASAFHVKFSEGFTYESQTVSVHPSFMGLWLGDGRRVDATVYNNNEQEIVEGFLAKYAVAIKLILHFTGPLAYSIVARERKPEARALPPLHVRINRMPGRRLTYWTIHNALKAAGYEIAARGHGGAGGGMAHLWKQPSDGDATLHKLIAPAQIQVLPKPGEISRAITHAAIGAVNSNSEGVTSSPAFDNTMDGASNKRKNPVDIIDISSTTSPQKKAKISSIQQQLGPQSEATKVAQADTHLQPLVQSHLLDIPSSQALSKDSGGSAPPSQTLPRIATGSPLEDYSQDKRSASSELSAPVETPVDLIEVFSDDPEIMALAGPIQVPLLDEADSIPTNNREVVDALDLFEVDEVSESEEDEEYVQKGIAKSKRLQLNAQVALDGVDNAVLSGLADEVLGRSYPVTAPSSTKTSHINHLLQALHALKVTVKRTDRGHEVDRKHIPAVFLRNDEKTRLLVLGGLLDSDGHLSYHKNEFSFTQEESSHNKLFWDTKQLALGLGFRTSEFRSHYPTKTGMHTKLILHISGDVNRIPCLLLRKQASERYLRHKTLVPVGDIEERGPRDCIAFDLDGEHYYLRGDRLVMVASNGFDPVKGKSAAEILKENARPNIVDVMKKPRSYDLERSTHQDTLTTQNQPQTADAVATRTASAFTGLSDGQDVAITGKSHTITAIQRQLLARLEEFSSLSGPVMTHGGRILDSPPISNPISQEAISDHQADAMNIDLASHAEKQVKDSTHAVRQQHEDDNVDLVSESSQPHSQPYGPGFLRTMAERISRDQAIQLLLDRYQAERATELQEMADALDDQSIKNALLSRVKDYGAFVGQIALRLPISEARKIIIDYHLNKGAETMEQKLKQFTDQAITAELAREMTEDTTLADQVVSVQLLQVVKNDGIFANQVEEYFRKIEHGESKQG